MYQDESEGEEDAWQGCSCSARAQANTCCHAHGKWEMTECCSAHGQWESQPPSYQWEKDALPAEWGDRFHKLRRLWSGHCCELQPFQQSAVSDCKGCANCAGTADTAAQYSSTDNWNKEDKYVQQCPCFMEKCIPLRECSCWKRIANLCTCQCLQQRPEEYQLLTSRSSAGEEVSETQEEDPDEQPDCSCVSSRENVLLEGTEGDCCGGVVQVLEDCNPKNLTYPACAYSCDCIGRDTQRLRRTGTQDHRNGTPRWPRKDPLLSRRSMSVQLLDPRCRINRSDVPYDEVLLDECHISLRPKNSQKQSPRREGTGEDGSKSNGNEGHDVEEKEAEEEDSEESLNDDAQGTTEEGPNELSSGQNTEEKKERKVAFMDSNEVIDQSKDDKSDDENRSDEKKSHDPESNDALYLYHNKDLFTPSSSVIIPKKVESNTTISILSPPTVPVTPPKQVQCLCEKINKGTFVAKQARDSILVHLKKKAKKISKGKPAVEEARDSILVHQKKRDKKKIDKGKLVAEDARDSILVHKKKRSKSRVRYNLEKKKNSSDLTEESVAMRTPEERGGILKNERVCGPCGRSRPASHRRNYSHTRSN